MCTPSTRTEHRCFTVERSARVKTGKLSALAWVQAKADLHRRDRSDLVRLHVDLTRDSGAAVQAEKYQCGHEVTVEVLKDLAAWLRALTLS